MDGRMKRNIFSAITYSALLILIIMNFKSITQFLLKFESGFNTFFVGIAIAFVLNKPCMYIEKVLKENLFKRNINSSILRGLSITITYLVFILTGVIAVAIILPQLVKSIQLILNNIGAYTDNLQALSNKITVFLHMNKIDLTSIETPVLGYINKLESGLLDVLSQIISITTGILFFLVNLLMAFIFSIYILFGKEKLLAQCKKFFSIYLPQNIYENCYYVNFVVIDIFNKYVIGQLIGALITGVLCMALMFIFRFDYPILIGVIIGITSLIPILGSYIGGFIAFILLLMINPIKAVWFIIFLIILIQVVGNIIYPKIIGSSIGLPSIWILLSIIVGGSLAGVLGILLGLPITAVLYALLKNDIKNRTSE
ncbi:MAG: AI-2E family transporter [Solirubrobacterales bacterium]